MSFIPQYPLTYFGHKLTKMIKNVSVRGIVAFHAILLLFTIWSGCSSPSDTQPPVVAQEEPEPDPCQNVTCQNGGTCDDGSCQCPEGFSGVNCEIVPEPDPCESIICENGGSCVDGLCECPPGFTGEFCQTPVVLSLQSSFGTEADFMVEIDDIFAIWWDKDFDKPNGVETVFTWLKQVRNECINDLGMMDPPNPAAGFYYNVYIHYPGEDGCQGCGNAQGTDIYGMPNLGFPVGLHLNYRNVLHEAFHVFQYVALSPQFEPTTPGFANEGDSAWYTEASASWYAIDKSPNDVDGFLGAGAMISNPQLALWHSFHNEAPGDPTDWLYQVRQYSMEAFLYFLVEESQVDRQILTSGFYSETELSPQEYIYTNVGGDQFRGFFTDWAAHNTGGIDYMSKEQVDRAMQEMASVGDPDNIHPYVHELTDNEANGVFSPPQGLFPRGWSYNVIKINNTEVANYAFSINGDSTGSAGAPAHFEAQIVVMGNMGPQYIPIDMSNELQGNGSVNVSAEDSELFLVITAVPEHFNSNQTYNYSVEIVRE